MTLITEDIVNKIIDYEMGLLDETETLEMFKTLGDTGLINQLQGSYQRTYAQLIREGSI